MRRERSLQNIIIIVLSIAVIGMSIGFATYASNLEINGTAHFTPASWDIHFVDSSFTEPSTQGAIHATNHTLTDTEATYEVTLPAPGSTYTFDVQVKNFGTIKGKLKKIELTNLNEAQAKYIEHTVTYDGTSYSTTTDNLAIAIEPNETQTATVTVTVKYNYPANASDLPSTAQTVNLGVKLYYVDFDATE